MTNKAPIKHPLLRQLGLLALCAVPVFALMFFCSLWNFASHDPYPTQMFWFHVGEVLGFPTRILPERTHGLIQFSVVLLFWSAALRFAFYLVFSVAATARHPSTQPPTAEANDNRPA